MRYEDVNHNQYRLGIMQGRFTEKEGFFPQHFPWDSWENEFFLLSDKGIPYLEWMLNYEKYDANPIVTQEGRERIHVLIDKLGVRVLSVCANYFMRVDVFKKANITEGVFRFYKEMAKELGIENIIIPLFDESENVNGRNLQEICYQWLSTEPQDKVNLLFETNASSDDMLSVMEAVSDSRIGICYDVGNAAGMGKNILYELGVLKPYIKEIHCKDKHKGGSSVMLGLGDVPWHDVFRIVGCGVPYVLESFYNNAVEDTDKNIKFLKKIMEETGYGFENGI